MQMPFLSLSPHGCGGRGFIGVWGQNWVSTWTKQGWRRQPVLTKQHIAASCGRACLFFMAWPNLFSLLQPTLPLEKGSRRHLEMCVIKWTNGPSPYSQGMLMGSKADGRILHRAGYSSWCSQIWGLSGQQAVVSYFLLRKLCSCLGGKENFCIASDKTKLAESGEEASSKIRPTSQSGVGTLFISGVALLVCARISFSFFLLPRAVLDGTVKTNLKSTSGLWNEEVDVNKCTWTSSV